MRHFVRFYDKGGLIANEKRMAGLLKPIEYSLSNPLAKPSSAGSNKDGSALLNKIS